MTSVVTAGGVSVTVRGEVIEQTEQVLERLVSDGVPGALAAGSPQLWGPDASAEAARRLGWLTLPETSRALLPRLAEIADRVRADGLDRVVLAGMGGSSLAPEVIARSTGASLTVLDTTDPLQVSAAIGADLDRTVVVVSSKSGGTIETDSHLRIFEQAFRDAGVPEAELGRRFVVVTDPGSPLERAATEAGYTVVLADPDVGGRYSALTAFGLVPAAIIGADPAALLDEAAALAAVLRQPYDNPGLALGAALGAAAQHGADKLVIADHGSGLPGFGDWAEQLIAESTGKEGRGLLPVVLEDVDAPGFQGGDDVRRVVLHGGAAAEGRVREAGISVSGPLGAQFLLWEYATAVAGRVIGINPFDQPNVQESKDKTAALLADPRALDAVAEPALVDGAVEVHAPPELLDGAKNLREVFDALLDAVPERGYLAVMAYLDRFGDAAAAELRPLLAARSAHGRRAPLPVTFGWGPRFLHSTGQYHKGGPQHGAFVQITGDAAADVPVPGRPYTLRRLQLAQAVGDLGALRGRGRPAVRLHLRDRVEGLARLRAALE